MDLRSDHFALFGLSRGFRLDLSDLDSRYRDIQAQVHPDRFVHAGEAERRLSMQWATHANEAYQTLKKPTSAAAMPNSVNCSMMLPTMPARRIACDA